MTAPLLPTRKPDLLEQMKSVRREISMRERVYPRFVEDGKMKQHVADHELACMRAVLDTVEAALKASR